MSNELGITDETIEELIALTSDSVNALASSNIDEDLPEGSRQILHVKDHVLISAGYISGGKTSTASVVLLAGTPSPSSDKGLRVAYIVFVPDEDQVRRPHYTASTGRIDIWLHQRQLPTILTQIHEGRVNCWIGHFANGHIYADVHTNH